MSDETSRNPRFRQVTFSINAPTPAEKDRVEKLILQLKEKWRRGIKGFAYAYHDQDVYTESDEKNSREKAEALLAVLDAKRMDYTDVEYAEKRKVIEDSITVAGTRKTSHWHVLFSFGNNAKSIDEIAAMMCIPSNLVCKVSGGKKGFANMLAYLTHITPDAKKKGKHEYPFDAVKGLQFPDDESVYSAFKDYADFARAFEDNALELELDALMVMSGKITPAELKEKNPKYYLNNLDKIKRARREYLNSLPTPKRLSNFYIGPLDQRESGSDKRGRIGKGLMARLLAISHLMQMFPDVDFMNMADDDLKGKYVFFAGGSNVTFDGYEGEPIIIWNDARSEKLISTFGSVAEAMDALDVHPKPIALHVKFDHVYLKNCINIFCGTETYLEFIQGLTTAYGEDETQAKGRLPYIIHISPEFIKAEAQLQYLIGTEKYNFCHIYENCLQALVQHEQLDVHAERIGSSFIEVENAIEDGSAYTLTVPEVPLREITENDMRARITEKRTLARAYEIIAEGYEILDKYMKDKIQPAWYFEEEMKKCGEKMLSLQRYIPEDTFDELEDEISMIWTDYEVIESERKSERSENHE